MNLGQHNIYTQTAESIISEWYQRGVDENLDFIDKFIYLWISFNAFYKAYSTGNSEDYNVFLSKQNNTRDSDRNQIEYIKKQFLSTQIDDNQILKKFHIYLSTRPHEDIL